MKEIDFLPRSFHQAMLRRYRTRRNVMLSVVLLAALGFSQLIMTSRIRSVEGSLIAVSGGDGQRRAQREQVSALQARKSALERQAALISRLDDDAPLDAVIGQINALMSDSMSLRSITVETVPLLESSGTSNSPRPALQKGGSGGVDALLDRGRTEVVLRAVAATDVEIGIFFGKLTASPLFDDIRLGFSREMEHAGRAMREFELKIAVKRVTLVHPQGGS